MTTAFEVDHIPEIKRRINNDTTESDKQLFKHLNERNRPPAAAVRNPQTGDAYPIREGAASKAGVMYEIADGTEIPNLGERIMAIMKTDGTVTAQRSQAANVSKNLTAVRQEMKNNKTVIFDSDGCYTYDKLSGSFTAIDDDGVNFIQDEWIIPPDELGQVLAALSDPDFTGQAP